MAPEIIQMSGFTTASDIWSVACTVIELVTGNPAGSKTAARPPPTGRGHSTHPAAGLRSARGIPEGSGRAYPSRSIA